MGNSVNIHKESLILFDEIDVVFKEDVGFFSAINHFIKKSKKPIVLTTTDDFLQDKINLNIEKIEFTRPRVDASIRFLKNIAKKENMHLEKHLAYNIVRECKCDMRRALVQLQTILTSSGDLLNSKRHGSSAESLKKYKKTLDLNKCLLRNLFSDCKYHNEIQFFNSLFFLDSITKKILKYNNLESTTNSFNLEAPTSFKKYDLFIIRDGLTDNNSLASNTTSSTSTNSNTNASTFNPFQLQQSIGNKLINTDDMVYAHSVSLKDSLCDFYDCFIELFNQNQHVDFYDWNKYGAINKFNFSSNVSVNKFAQAMCLFTSNSSLMLDYRPYLLKICKYEQLKQDKSKNKRR